MTKEHKLAALSAFILDEGSTTNEVQMCSANKNLLQGIRELCQSLEYSVSTPLKKDIYYFRIHAQSIPKLCSDLEELFIKFPDLNINDKFDGIKAFTTKSYFRGRKDFKQELKDSILKNLKTKEWSAKQLSRKHEIAIRTCYRYLNQLLEEEKVIKIKSRRGFTFRASP